MSELDSVFLVLVLIYGTECTAWMQPQTVAFFRAFSARWRVTNPLCLFGPGQGGLVFGNPLPPLGTVFVSYPWPIVLSPHAVARSEADAVSDTDAFAYESLTSIDAVSKEVHLNDARFVSGNSASGARFFADLIQQVAATPVHQRQRCITDALGKALDVEDIQVAVASVLCPTHIFRDMARQTLYDLQHACSEASTHAAPSAWTRPEYLQRDHIPV